MGLASLKSTELLGFPKGLPCRFGARTKDNAGAPSSSAQDFALRGLWVSEVHGSGLCRLLWAGGVAVEGAVPFSCGVMNSVVGGPMARTLCKESAPRGGFWNLPLALPSRLPFLSDDLPAVVAPKLSVQGCAHALELQGKML